MKPENTPEAAPFDQLLNVPAEMQAYPQWVVWRYEQRGDGKPTKVPYDAKTGEKAAVDNPSTWSTFDTIGLALQSGRWNGAGFVFTKNDPFAGVDLDVAEGAAPSDVQQFIYGKLNSYAELSPSGRGVHIIVKGEVPKGRNSQELGVEVYSWGRFFTVTGNTVNPIAIQDRATSVRELWDEIGGVFTDETAGPLVIENPAVITDDALVARICASGKNNAYFNWTAAFDWSEAYRSVLGAACLFSSDEAQIARVILNSPLVTRAPAHGGETRPKRVARLWAKEYGYAARQGDVERGDYPYRHWCSLFGLEPQAAHRGRYSEALADGQTNAAAIIAADGARKRVKADADRSKRVKSARTLQDRAFPQLRWAVSNVLPEGLTIFAGVPKVGKSWFMLHTAIAKAAGGLVLGQDCERGDVLLLALEDNERRLQDRFRLVTSGEDWPENLHYATEWSRLNEGGIAEIESWIDSVPNPSLIVIDTLAMVKPVATGRNKSAYDHDVDALKPLHRLASEKRIAIVVITHTRKQQAEDPVERVSSTLGLTGVADTIMLMGKAPKEHSAILYARGRDIAEYEVAIKFEKHRWEVEGDPTQVFAGDAQKLIIEAMSKGATTPKEIAKAIGKSDEAVRQTLQRMLAQQRVYRHEYGKYTLPAWTETPQFFLEHPITPVTPHSSPS